MCDSNLAGFSGHNKGPAGTFWKQTSNREELLVVGCFFGEDMSVGTLSQQIRLRQGFSARKRRDLVLTGIGVLFRFVRLKVDGFHWFGFWCCAPFIRGTRFLVYLVVLFHRPGEPIDFCPKRPPVAASRGTKEEVSLGRAPSASRGFMFFVMECDEGLSVSWAGTLGVSLF